MRYGRTRSCRVRSFPYENVRVEKQDFIYTFFPFMFGIYPYTFVTVKQRTAMEATEVNYVFLSIYEITYNFVKRLLANQISLS